MGNSRRHDDRSAGRVFFGAFVLVASVLSLCWIVL